MNTIFSLWLAAVCLLFAISCSPVSISRIGLARPPKPPGCPVEVLAPGESPNRPTMDIGVVALSNCQEYTTRPCRDWLEKAVCEMGGEVAYLPEPKPPQNEFDAVNYRVLVAISAVGGESLDDGVCKEPEKTPDKTATDAERCVE